MQATLSIPFLPSALDLGGVPPTLDLRLALAAHLASLLALSRSVRRDPSRALFSPWLRALLLIALAAALAPWSRSLYAVLALLGGLCLREVAPALAARSQQGRSSWIAAAGLLALAAVASAPRSTFVVEACAGLACAQASQRLWLLARRSRVVESAPRRAGAGSRGLCAASAVLAMASFASAVGYRVPLELVLVGSVAASAALVLARFEWELLEQERSSRSALRLEQGVRRAAQVEKEATLAAQTAHELASPLTAILGHAQELRANEPSPAQSRALEVIEQQAERCVVLVRELGARAAARRRRRVDPLVLAQRVLRGLEPKARAHEVELCLRAQTDLPAIAVDTTGIEQALVNLLENAISVTPPHGAVELGVGATNGPSPEVEFEVLDTGAGIEPRAAARLFEPYFTTRAERGGTGLGLSTAREIVERNGGTLSGASCAGGRGARFALRLPAASAREVTDAALGPLSAATTESTQARARALDGLDRRPAALARSVVTGAA